MTNRLKTIAAIERALEHHGIAARVWVDDKGRTWFLVGAQHVLTVRQADIYCAGLADKEALTTKLQQRLDAAEEQLAHTRTLLRHAQDNFLAAVRRSLPPPNDDVDGPDDHEAIAYDPYTGIPEPDFGWAE